MKVNKKNLTQAVFWAMVICMITFVYGAYDEWRYYKVFSYIGEEGEQYNIYRKHIDGHFYVEGTIGNKSVMFLVDTGATKTIISEYDAMKLGIVVPSGHYVERYETPNGVISAAPVVIEKIKIGHIELNNVRASVSRMSLRQSILGMNVLSQLNMSFTGNRMMISEATQA